MATVQTILLEPEPEPEPFPEPEWPASRILDWQRSDPVPESMPEAVGASRPASPGGLGLSHAIAHLDQCESSSRSRSRSRS
jgi:hypothetical protein